MRNKILLNISDPLAALSDLASQVRLEVDAATPEVSEDQFNNSAYRGAKEFRRQHHARKAVYQRAKMGAKKRWASIRKHNLSLAQPGEMLLGDWLKEQCKLSGHDRSWVLHRFNKGAFPYMAVRRVNLRLVFVRPNALATDGHE